jgi:hypothetical protein
MFSRQKVKWIAVGLQHNIKKLFLVNISLKNSVKK